MAIGTTLYTLTIGGAVAEEHAARSVVLAEVERRDALLELNPNVELDPLRIYAELGGKLVETCSCDPALSPGLCAFCLEERRR